ncbi:nitroreductase family protein [Beggiatoa leptomitoformis]|uniref:Nitroreductase n=1 Tax=Beggiatoa leptomitoformis TaxID=288004 RepID=A0A2N9YG51_9GAMM|nr:nitroreductase family protein [Beggiatoa leptomitoformis]ALG68203.1 nitroreductase [Beggiatoa leptomitoformis]AUI69492.1 nitroreductase [Beggiatoa leptomitoformis]
MKAKHAVTVSPVHDLIATRWSPRAYDANKPVSREQILSLLEAARWSPSCFGDEPWRFIVCDKTSNPSAWEQAFSCLAEGNQTWVKNVPVILLAMASDTFKHNGQTNRWAQYDTGAASENLCLQAVALGLMAHQMGGFDPTKAKTVFDIPEGITCMAMIAVGYQAAEETLTNDLKEREAAPRQRIALEKQFFDGVWGKGII